MLWMRKACGWLRRERGSAAERERAACERRLFEKLSSRIFMSHRETSRAHGGATNGIPATVSSVPCERRLVEIDVDLLHLEVRVEAVRPELASEPGLLVAAPRRFVVRRMVRVQPRSEEHTSELQSHSDLVCRLLLEKKKYADLFSLNVIAY